MGKTYSPKEAARRAKKLIGENDYSLEKRNCEDIATECKTGKARSKQIETLKSFDAIDIIGAPIWLVLYKIFGK